MRETKSRAARIKQHCNRSFVRVSLIRRRMMKRQSVLVYALLILVALDLGVAAAAKADFSGTWVLDAAQSESVPSGMEQTMTIAQAGDKLDVDLKIKGPQGERALKYSYELNGKQTEFTAEGPQGATSKAKRTAAWSADGNSIEVKEEIPVQTPEGPDTVYDTRKWTLAADGKSLTIERKTITPTGTQQNKRVFVKKA